MCMKKNNNRLLRGVAAVLCLALMFLTMSGMAMATDMEDAPAGGAPESTPEIVEAELPVTPEETPEPPPAEQGPDTQEPAPAPPETTETPQPEAEYALDADIPAGWHNAPVTITVRIVDKKGTGWNKAEAALGENAQRTDLTEQLAHDGRARYTVPDNGIVFFFVTDPYGTEHTLTLELRCIDLEAPVLRAGVSGTLLRVEAADTLSGIAGVYVNDELYTTLQNGEFSVRIDKNTRDSHFYIMGVDNAGNRTGYLVIANPFYEKETPAPSPTPEQHSAHCPADCDCRKQPPAIPAAAAIPAAIPVQESPPTPPAARESPLRHRRPQPQSRRKHRSPPIPPRLSPLRKGRAFPKTAAPSPATCSMTSTPTSSSSRWKPATAIPSIW